MIKDVLNIIGSVRKHNRKAVIFPACLKVDGLVINCTAYDVSLGGVRVKTNIVIRENQHVLVQLKNKIFETAKVVWSREGFIGLDFQNTPNLIKSELGLIAVNLN